MSIQIIIAVVAAVCAVAAVGIPSALFVLLRGRRQNATANTLAAEMGLEGVNPRAGWKTAKWFGGRHNGRAFAFASVNVAAGRELGGGAATRVLSWSVAIEVLRDMPIPGARRGTLPELTATRKAAFKDKYGSLRLGNRVGMQSGVLVPELFPGRDVVAMVTLRGNAPDAAAVHRMVDELAEVARELEKEG